ncbi:MerR family transcriptional regulator [Streptomyces sp. NPDC050610]|uniref:MerR family transcriptional regulator n=1 Tax=Streptomyces sp. NPDC050610 TaxID=3157097 RepID=UPI003445E939
MRIGELAALAAVSPRTVRHYHHLGLLPEPPRLANGYRAYGLRDAVALTRVRRLTDLGLSLDEVRDVLADGSGRELREVLGELDADLARQEAAVRERRARVAVLLRQAEEGALTAEGPVSAELAALYAEMARVGAARPGPEPATAAKERELLALLETAAAPEDRERLVALLRSTAAEPGAMERAYEVYALLDTLADADPADPRVDEAARLLADCLPPGVAAEIAAEAEAGVGVGVGENAQDGFVGVLFSDFSPAQAAAVRGAMRLLVSRAQAGGDPR